MSRIKDTAVKFSLSLQCTKCFLMVLTDTQSISLIVSRVSKEDEIGEISDYRLLEQLFIYSRPYHSNHGTYSIISIS